MQSLARIFKTTLIIGVVSQLIGCNTGPDVNFEAWQEKQSSSAVQYTVDEEVKITLNWSRIGPFSRYNTRLRANAFSGLIDIYGAQTCLGKYVRDDRLSPAHGWWEIVCPDESYAAGISGSMFRETFKALARQSMAKTSRSRLPFQIEPSAFRFMRKISFDSSSGLPHL